VPRAPDLTNSETGLAANASGRVRPRLAAAPTTTMAAKAKLCALVAARPTKASVSPRVQHVRTVLPPPSSVAYRVVRPLPKPAAVTPMGVVGRSIAQGRALPARRVRGRPTPSVPPLSSVCKPCRRSCRSLNDELRASKLCAVGTQHDGL